MGAASGLYPVVANHKCEIANQVEIAGTPPKKSRGRSSRVHWAGSVGTRLF